jgi:photosystem II stability/assembly factor-like uncharacterized protein
MNGLTKARVRRLAIWTVMLGILGRERVGAADNVWASVGPEGGGVQSLAVDPQNPGTVYASTQFNVYRSTDGAVSWVNTGFTGHANGLVIDPRNSDTIYAPTPTGVSKSTDAGASWSAASSGLPGGWPILQLIIDPQNSGTLYALTMIAGPGTFLPAAPNVFVPTVFKTADGGTTWNPASSGLAPGNYALTVAVDPRNPGMLYAGTTSGPFPGDADGAIYKSTDGGASWGASGAGITNCCVSALAIDPQDSKIIYAAWMQSGGVGGIVKSTDGGTTWTDLGSGLPGASTLAFDPQDPATLYALTSTGFFKSTNGGTNWNPANLAGQVQTFAIDPQNPATVYAAVVLSSGADFSGSGVFKTTDGGSSWNATNSGIREIPVRDVAIDPQHAGTLYAANGGKVLKTTDGGVHWTSGDIDVWKLAIDPRDPGTVFALLNDSSGQPAKSTDGGASWSRLSLPLASDDGVWDLAIDPQNSSVVYVGTDTEGVLKSTDGGASWIPANAGLPQEGINILATSGPKQTTLYASTASECDCGLLGDGMFKSTDGGSSWTAINSGLPGGSVVQGRVASSVAVDPKNPATLYIGLSWIGLTGNDPYSRGLFKSIDGGVSWKQLSTGLPEGSNFDFGPIAIDPRDRGTVYVGSDAGILRSTDGGETWSVVNFGLPAISSLALDPQDPNRLYVGTYGGLFVTTFPAGRRTIRF